MPVSSRTEQAQSARPPREGHPDAERAFDGDGRGSPWGQAVLISSRQPASSIFTAIVIVAVVIIEIELVVIETELVIIELRSRFLDILGSD